MDPQTHWEKIYQEKAPDAVSWYRPHLETSLGLIQQVAPEHSAAIVDVGGGESILVDDLLACNYEDITVLDIFANCHRCEQKTTRKDFGACPVARRRHHQSRPGTLDP